VLDEADKATLDAIRRRAITPRADASPQAKSIADAMKQLNEGNVDGARATLLTALETSPDNPGMLDLLSRLEISVGNRDKALEYNNKVLELQPNNVRAKTLNNLLTTANPIEGYMKSSEQAGGGDEGNRAVARVVGLSMMEQQFRANEATERAAGRIESADKALGYADLAKAELARQLELAQQLKPDDPTIYEYRFNQALREKDWGTAEDLLVRIKELNIDTADGLLFQGRYERASGKVAQSVRTLETAVSRVDFSSAGWRELGLSYQMLGNNGQAINAYEKAYERNPNDTNIAREYTSLLLAQGDQPQALKVLETLRRLAPRDEAVRDVWMQLEYRFGDKVKAFRARRDLYEMNPRNTGNASALAIMLATTEPTWDLVVDDQDNPKVDATRWARMTREERADYLLRARAEWTAEADTIISQLSEGQPDTLELAMTRSRLLMARGDEEGAEQSLQEFIDRQAPEAVTANMLLALASIQKEIGKPDAAIATMKSAEAKQGPQREANAALAMLYFNSGLYEQSLTHLQKVLEADPSPLNQQKYVECLLRAGKPEEARQRLQSLTSDGHSSSVTSLLEASIAQALGVKALAAGNTALANEEFVKQKAALDLAQSQDTTSPMPYLVRAQALAAEYERTGERSALDDALVALDNADKVRAGLADTTYLRVRIHRLRSDLASAASSLTKLVELQPDNTLARQQLVNLHAEMGHNEVAMQVVDDALSRYPSSGVWHEAKGDLYKLRKNDFASAANSYLDGFHATPNGTLLTKYVEAALGVTNPPVDYRALLKVIRDNEKYLAGTPYLRVLYVRALMGARQKDLALEQLREAYQQYRTFIGDGRLHADDIDRFSEALTAVYGVAAPQEIESFMNEVSSGNLDPYELRMLAVLHSATGTEGMKRAIDLETQAIAKCTDQQRSTRVFMLQELAVYYMGTQQWPEAGATYEKALELDPNLPDALNNLAYLNATNFNNPDKALPLAERALSLRPDSATFMDTLGWVYYKQGKLDKAREYLERSMTKQESVGTAVNLATVLIDVGALDDADRIVQRGMALNAAAKPQPDAAVATELTRLGEMIQTKRLMRN